MKLIVYVSMMCLIGCSAAPSMRIAVMPKLPTKGPLEYRQGWEAGCNTGMTAYSHTILRTLYHAEVNGHYMQHPYYNKGWELGQRYCSYYVSAYLGNKEMTRFSQDPFTTADLRSKNSWISLTSDGLFHYGLLEGVPWF